MKLLTFLGVARYELTRYAWQGEEKETRFAPVASCEFLKPDEVVVFLTEEAQQKVAEDFTRDLPSGVKMRSIPIPLGKNETELWEIFDHICASVSDGEEVAFDITHGLRSSPLLGLISATYLRSSFNIHLRAVLYGAYDIGRALGTGVTPMFDLTPLLSLLEWSIAADRFNRTGDARYLGELVRDQRSGMAAAAKGNPELLENIGRLGNLAGALGSISESLRLIRPVQTMEQTAGLNDLINRARPALDRHPATRPFALLLDTIHQSYASLGLKEPLSPANLAQSLDTQRRIIDWYVQRQQWVQAVTLAREWLVNWFMLRLKITDLQHRELRERVEKEIAAEASQMINMKDTGKPFSPMFLPADEQILLALDLWNQLVDIRNDVNHAGMRPRPRSPDDIIKSIRGINEKISALEVNS